MPMKIWEAIPRMEGFYIPGSRANRNHNPGNIEWGEFAEKHGAIGLEKTPPHETARFAYFSTNEAGFSALKDLLLTHYNGQTIEQVMQHYAPTSENDTEKYVANICTWCSCSPDTVINNVM